MRRDNEFDIYYLNKDDRLNFLFMAVKHPILGQFKDIRLYLAKWFFYDVLNVLDRLTELALKYYNHLDVIQIRDCIKEELMRPKNNKFKSTPLKMLQKQSTIRFKVFQKPWFWGFFFYRERSVISMRGYVYIACGMFWYHPLGESVHDVAYPIGSKEFLELMNKLDNK